MYDNPWSQLLREYVHHTPVKYVHLAPRNLGCCSQSNITCLFNSSTATNIRYMSVITIFYKPRISKAYKKEERVRFIPRSNGLERLLQRQPKHSRIVSSNQLQAPSVKTSSQEHWYLWHNVWKHHDKDTCTYKPHLQKPDNRNKVSESAEPTKYSEVTGETGILQLKRRASKQAAGDTERHQTPPQHQQKANPPSVVIWELLICEQTILSEIGEQWKWSTQAEQMNPSPVIWLASLHPVQRSFKICN
jgi:hypothetical protein